MNLKPFTDIEKTIGGRPKSDETKVRLSFYVSQVEADQLKTTAQETACSVSQIVRLIVRNFLSNGEPID